MRLLPAALLFAACGAEAPAVATDTTPSTVGANTDYADALAAAIAPLGDSLGISEEQAFCLANGMVDVFGGAEQLREDGITPEQLQQVASPAELGLGQSAQSTEDLDRVLVLCSIDVTSIFIDGLAVSLVVTAETEACIRDAVDETFLRTLVIDQLLGRAAGPPPEEFTSALAPCLQIAQMTT